MSAKKKKKKKREKTSSLTHITRVCSEIEARYNVKVSNVTEKINHWSTFLTLCHNMQALNKEKVCYMAYIVLTRSNRRFFDKMNNHETGQNLVSRALV